MKTIGLDYHGVITANPRLFSLLTKILKSLDYTIHIITGSRITEQLKEQISAYGITYTHIFSIADYHHQVGTKMTGYEEHQPQLDDELWNTTKANYCIENKVILHVDDSVKYGLYFRTPFCLFRGVPDDDESTLAELTRLLTEIKSATGRAWWKQEEVQG
jgi:hypothetical protein